MQALLKSNLKTNEKKKMQEQKKKMKKVIYEYDSFSINKEIIVKVKRIGKTVIGGSIKRGCQQCFVAKKTFS